MSIFDDDADERRVVAREVNRHLACPDVMHTIAAQTCEQSLEQRLAMFRDLLHRSPTRGVTRLVLLSAAWLDHGLGIGPSTVATADIARLARIDLPATVAALERLDRARAINLDDCNERLATYTIRRPELTRRGRRRGIR